MPRAPQPSVHSTAQAPDSTLSDDASATKRPSTGWIVRRYRKLFLGVPKHHATRQPLNASAPEPRREINLRDLGETLHQSSERPWGAFSVS